MEQTELVRERDRFRDSDRSDRSERSARYDTSEGSEDMEQTELTEPAHSKGQPRQLSERKAGSSIWSASECQD